MRVEIEGLDELRKVLEGVANDKAMKGLAIGVYEVTNEVFSESQVEVPVDTGTLASSGAVTRPTTTSTSVESGITYGGAAASYAFVVHERITAYHAPPTKAKYLEDPMRRAAPGFGRKLAAATERALRELGV